MKEITIEDVLKKHGFHYEQKSYTVDSFALYNAVKAAMTEYASLNRQGWTRVEDEQMPLEQFILVSHEYGIEAINFHTGAWRYRYSNKPLSGTTLKSITHWMLPNKPSNI